MFFIYFYLVFSSTSLRAIPEPASSINSVTDDKKQKVIQGGGKSVESLIKIIKSSHHLEQQRWSALFLLARIMGKKSVPFIATFLHHSKWFMRMASLKILLTFKEKGYFKDYAKLLKDPALIVRVQALHNVEQLQLSEIALQIWPMLYDKRNYYLSPNKKWKRMNVIKKIIKSIGILQVKKAKKPFFVMIQKDRYDDIFNEIEFALSLLTNQKIPTGKRSQRRYFWKKIAQNSMF